MRTKIGKKEVEDCFVICQNNCKELKKYSLDYSDIRCGKLVALAIRNKETGSINRQSEYMQYNEFISFLNGYYSKSVKKY